MTLRTPSALVSAGALAVLAASLLPAQVASTGSSEPRSQPDPRTWCVIVPQSRAYAFDQRAGIEVVGVEADVQVMEQVATTALDVVVRNPESVIREAILLVPVPAGAAVRSFAFAGSSSEPTAKVLPRDEARAMYESIVRKARDPGLLEFAGLQFVRTSVFPLAAGATQRVRLVYEQILPADDCRIDYVLPRSEAAGYRVPWKVSVQLASRSTISTVYSPSHAVEASRTGPGAFSVRLTDAASRQPGPFRLSYLLERDGVTASLIAYPDPAAGGGYFLLLAGLPARSPSGGDARLRREVTLVLDRSGSMRGEKFEQARKAALAILNGLDEGEFFNILPYSDAVERFGPAPIAKSRETIARATEYLLGLTTLSGTNLHDALFEALRQPPTPGCLPLVLFLTDGLPTVGKTSEKAIRDVATLANPHSRRVFTFGVGFDVNTPLLEGIAADTRAATTFVLPGEDVEVKVAQVFRRLSGPVLAGPELAFLDTAGKLGVPPRASDVFPSKLPDLFAGDQLVVMGRYSGAAPLAVSLKGNFLGGAREFQFSFGLEHASTANAFVLRLWAARKIAFLVDALRRLGAEGGAPGATSGTAGATTDPRLRELVDEVVRLSTEFGILTEYTAFLAAEGTDFTKKEAVRLAATANFVERALNCRTGAASLNQELNNQSQKAQACLNPSNSYIDANLHRVEIVSVQQIHDATFFRKGGRWVDGRALANGSTAEPTRIVEFGSPEFRALLEKLLATNRPGCLSLGGDIVLRVDGETVLVRAPAAAVE
jgi:Ca-activated chloride channel family protein